MRKRKYIYSTIFTGKHLHISGLAQFKLILFKGHQYSYRHQLYFFLNFYLFMIVTERERERGAETQAEGETGSLQGARRRTRSRVSRITP